MENDVNTTTRETKEQMGNGIRKDVKKLKINNWTSCIQDRNNGNYMLRGAKRSKIEVVTPKEEEEEFEKQLK